MKVYWLSVLALVACTKRNPAVCCLDKADCDEAGLREVLTCAPGLACVEHECVIPSCSTTGCEATTPVCNITTDVCEGCTDSRECARFADNDVCDMAIGACVECVLASDCSATEPICEGSACRVCRLDSECSSGACGDDGACVPEDSIVYLDPSASDMGACTRAAPCRTLTYGVTRTSPVRAHFVFAPGAYVENANLDAQTTKAQRLYLHGGGATLSSATEENSTLRLHVPSTVRDLVMSGPLSNAAITLYNGPHLVERVSISGANIGIGVTTAADIRDVTIASSGIGVGIALAAGAQLNLDRSVLHGGTNGLRSDGFGVTVNLTNVLVWGTTGLALDLKNNVGGTVSFSTIADSGSDAGTGPRAVFCEPALTVRSSIIWAPGTTARVPIAGCNLVSTIAGPTPTPGAANTDPMFVNSAARDYHISSNSPARDAVDSGPGTDIDGELRPQGARFDIGADEAAP